MYNQVQENNYIYVKVAMLASIEITLEGKGS